MKMQLKKIDENKFYVEFTREKDGATRGVNVSKEELTNFVKETFNPLSILTMDQFQKNSKSFCLDNSYSYTYLGDGIVEELGEFKGKIAKMVRKGILPVNFTREDILNLPEETRHGLMLELGDLCWFVAVLAEWCGWSLSYIGNENTEKLADRNKRNKIDGEGDYR